MPPRLLAAIILLLGSTGADAQIHALDAGRDLNNSVNLSQFVIARGWNGLMAEGLVGIDAPKNRLVLAAVDFPTYLEFKAVLKEDLPPVRQVLLADIHDKSHRDVVLLAGDRGYIWTRQNRGAEISRRTSSSPCLSPWQEPPLRPLSRISTMTALTICCSPQLPPALPRER